MKLGTTPIDQQGLEVRTTTIDQQGMKLVKLEQQLLINRE